MRCDRCGRDNPEELRFCQDCGNRLQAQEHAPEPTPPRGLSADGHRPRPEAPTFDFTPKGGTEDDRTCGRCGVHNPGDARFCAECGAPLEAARAGAPVVGVAPAKAEPAELVCSRCRGKNAPHMAYCQYCGAKLEEALPAAPAAPVPREARPEAHPAEVRPAEPRPPEARPAEPRPAPAASPAKAAASGQGQGPRLVVIAQDGSPGREYELSGDQTDVGREGGEIRLPSDPYVSPRHARLERRQGRYFLRDLGSTNGVYLRLRGETPIADGDLLLIGLEVLRFEVVSDAEKGFGPAVDQGTHVFGSPATPRYARLRQSTVEGVGRDIYHVCREETVIGRENGDIVFTADPFMSRRHAVISRNPVDGSFSLRDLGSSNGTFLALRQERALEDGDHVRIGQHLFRIELQPGRSSGR
ncbi:MAG: FHA domain-containing protein [Polyangiaceae bacterium]